MTINIDTLADQIAARIRMERDNRNWSMDDMAARSGVSKAAISKIERAESSPTISSIGRLCGAFGMTLSTFLTRAEGMAGRLVRASDQPSWTEPETGCVRTLISPIAGGKIEIVTVDLPPNAEVIFPSSIYAVFQQTIWITAGVLTLLEGEIEHCLKAGDCLELGPPVQCAFRNKTKKLCRYVVAASKRE